MSTDIYEKLEKNYKDEIKQTVEFWKSKGHIIVRINEGLQIWHYNARLNDFLQAMTMKQAIDRLTSQCPNYYDIFMTFDDYISIICDTLPMVSGAEIDDFRKYNEAKKYIKDDTILKADFDKLQDEIKDHQRPVIKNAPDDVREHIQAFINDGIVFCRYSDGSSLKKNGLFKYDKKGQKWDKISDTYILNLLKKVFSSDFTEKSIQWKYKTYYDGLIESNLPYMWNKQKEYKDTIKNFNNPKIDGSQWV